MLGRRLKREPREDKPDRLDLLVAKMEAALEGENFEELPALLEEFDRELDRAIKGGFITADALKRFQKVLKHLEEKAKKKREELQQKENQLKKLRPYGEFG